MGPFKDSFMPKNIVPDTEPEKYNGFYIEAGAGDGEIISNSLYFEINYKVIYNNNNLTDEMNEKCVFHKQCL